MRLHRLSKLFMLSLSGLPAFAGPGSWITYSGEDRFVVYLGIHKPLIWSFRESDVKSDPDNPFDEGESKFDLKEIAEEDGYPTGIHASVNLFGIVEPRISLEWFKFHFEDNSLSFSGTPVYRSDYALDVLLGFDINRIRGRRIAGLLYQLYPYLYAGMGYTNYTEKFTVAGGETRSGNFVLADVSHLNLGFGARYGLAKVFNAGAEIGIKSRDFKTVEPPQPSGRAGEGHFRVYLAAGFGR